ncbi:MAG TPA: DNA-3-methyladenine glycosylase 2 family protein, partial [Candidatus Paceibacterota bacterium]|nr:DNA-3-methyladenine glycosylase 2 family protein [Candidatus Paceibacterota bacterium]
MSPEAIEHLRASDKTMARLIQQVGACTLKPKNRRQPFEALVTAVTHQQLNGTAAMTILKRVLALYPGRRFPTPVDLINTPDETLRSAGLSRAKTAAIKDIAAKAIEGVVPTSAAIRKLSDAEILERLTSVRGVGPWTVEMLLIFTLGRKDVLPVSDYGVRKGFAITYGWKELPTPKELAEYGRRWSP